jgi:hypothetical protein
MHIQTNAGRRAKVAPTVERVFPSNIPPIEGIHQCNNNN